MSRKPLSHTKLSGESRLLDRDQGRSCLSFLGLDELALEQVEFNVSLAPG